MERYKKLLLISMPGIVVLSILLSGCLEYQGKTNAPRENELSDNIVSYCAKEKSKENRIYYNYPQFNETVSNADKLNQTIEEFVINALQRSDEAAFKGDMKDSPEDWEWNDNEYTLLAMDISYRITRSDLDYFSVVFEGDYNHKYAAHPMNYFDSLIIDVQRGEAVNLSLLYNIDKNFITLFRNAFKEQIRSVVAERMEGVPYEVSTCVEEQLTSYDDSKLQEVLQQSVFRSFLTDKGLGISVPFGHAMGDHYEILINYDKLVGYTYDDNNNMTESKTSNPPSRPGGQPAEGGL